MFEKRDTKSAYFLLLSHPRPLPLLAFCDTKYLGKTSKKRILQGVSSEVGWSMLDLSCHLSIFLQERTCMYIDRYNSSLIYTYRFQSGKGWPEEKYLKLVQCKMYDREGEKKIEFRESVPLLGALLAAAAGFVYIIMALLIAHFKSQRKKRNNKRK